MAARGNRITGVGRFGVAFLATAAFGLASVQPVLAESAPAPPAESTNADTTDAPPTPPAPPAENDRVPARARRAGADTDASADPAVGRLEPEAHRDRRRQSPREPAVPRRRTQAHRAAARRDEAGADPGADAPAPTPAPKDAVKLEPAPAPAPAPATAAAPTAPAPAATAPAGAPQATPVVLVQNTPAAPDTAAAKTEALLAAAAVVSFRPRAAAGPISLLPETATAAKAARKAPAVPAAARKPLPRQQTCARPAGRMPMLERCKQVRAVAGAQVTITYIQSLPEARAAIARGAPPRATVSHVEARPPPDSKAAKKRPVAEVRPIVPFGHSGQGLTNDGFSGSAGSSSSPRLFALAVVPLRVPWPSRFARLRLPSTLPHGVIPAPPSARPG